MMTLVLLFTTPQKAFKFFETAAKQGHPEGLYFYGKMLLNGRGTGVNFSVGAQALLVSAEKGYAPAQLLLAEIYTSGKGIQISESLALKWLRHLRCRNTSKRIIS